MGRELPLLHGHELQSALDTRKPGDMLQSIVESGVGQVPPDFVKPHTSVCPDHRSSTRKARPIWQIPEIDLAMLDDEGAGKRQLQAETARACDDPVCFHMINHGVPAPVMDAAMDAAKRFFALPAAEKEEFRMTKVAGKGYGRLFDRPGVAKDWNDRLVLNDFTGREETKSGGGAFYDLVLTNPPDVQ